MRTNPLRVLVAVAAIGALVFTNVAFAQDRVEIPPTEGACEASGRHWVPENAFDQGYPAFCGPGPNEAWGPEDAVRGFAPQPAPAEQAPVEPTPSAELPQSEPAPAQQGAPQYTG